ncbi:MAG: hypothetical protein P8H62_11425 [Henriciella sp.]|nr:hypothetical protein [Henriciella sp.]
MQTIPRENLRGKHLRPAGGVLVEGLRGLHGVSLAAGLSGSGLGVDIGLVYPRCGHKDVCHLIVRCRTKITVKEKTQANLFFKSGILNGDDGVEIL